MDISRLPNSTEKDYVRLERYQEEYEMLMEMLREVSWTGKSWPNKNVMIEYKTQKKERYYSEAIRLYTELGYSIGHISRIFPLSYGTVKRWLSIFAEEERKDNESAMKKKSSTPQNHMDTNEEIKALKAQIARSERNFNNARIKAELYNDNSSLKNSQA